jgi:hypothetical protein
MKSFLLVAILAIVACGTVEDRILEIVTCLVRNEKVKENVVNVVKALKTKDLPTIVSAAVSAYGATKYEVKKCIDFEPVLTKGCGSQYLRCVNHCAWDIFGVCRKDCYNAYCL